MTDEIVTAPNYLELIEHWKQQEREGVQFPVPLHEYFRIAGHSTKQKAFALAKSRLRNGLDFTSGTQKTPGRGRKILTMDLTVKALESFMNLADTESNPVKANSSKKRQYVYFIHCKESRAVKIGIAFDPESRMKDLQIGNPFKLAIARTMKVRKAFSVEQSLHRAFADFRLEGEWFMEEVMNFIACPRRLDR